jgi:hypothetical protein
VVRGALFSVGLQMLCWRTFPRRNLLNSTRCSYPIRHSRRRHSPGCGMPRQHRSPTMCGSLPVSLHRTLTASPHLSRWVGRKSAAPSADFRHRRPAPDAKTDDFACGLPKRAVVSGTRSHRRSPPKEHGADAPSAECASAFPPYAHLCPEALVGKGQTMCGPCSIGSGGSARSVSHPRLPGGSMKTAFSSSSARHASPMHQMGRYTVQRRRAILVASVIDLEMRLTDAALDMADKPIGGLFARA